jgi:imidazolonepropionase-like amidohydrolase
VPELLKKMHGGPPVVAQFATHSNYKLESARGSEYAPKILADAGITSTLKSDHPVLDSRYLIWEAAQSHMFGLNWTLAMDGVFASSAKAIGMDHRIGHVRAGHDADGERALSPSFSISAPLLTGRD